MAEIGLEELNGLEKEVMRKQVSTNLLCSWKKHHSVWEWVVFAAMKRATP